jgi:uncharacterized protein involved in outer membrane biogenesis
MKYIYRTLIGLTLLLFIFLLGAHFYFTPARLQSLLLPYLQNALQRKVSFQNAHLHYGIKPNISIGNLVIQGRPGFTQHPLIQADFAQISISPISLLRGRIGTLNLKNSTISITVNPQGVYSIDDLTQSKKTTVPINHLQLSHAILSFHNQQTARKTVLHIENATLLAMPGSDGIGLTGDISILKLITQTQKDTAYIPALDLSLKLHYDPNTKTIDVNNASIRFGPLDARLAGHINLRTSGIELQTQNEPLNFGHIQSYLIEQKLMPPQSVVSGEGTLGLHISGPWPPTIKGHLTINNLSMTGPGPLKHPVINGELDLFMDAQSMRISALKFQSGRTDINLSGVLSGLRLHPHLSFALISSITDVDELLSPGESDQAEWGFSSAVQAGLGTKKSALISLINRLDMDGSFRADSLRYHNTWITNFDAVLNAQNGTLLIKPITGQAQDGALNANLRLTPGEQGAHLSSSLSLTNADANLLLNQTLAWQVPLYGSLSLNTRLEGSFDSTLTFLPSTTNATGSIHMPAGQLVRWRMLQDKLNSIAHLDLLTADEVPIQYATVLFNMQGGTLSLDGTQFTVAQMPARLNGTSQSGGLLNYTLDVDLSPSGLQFGGFNLGSLLGQRAIPIRIHIRGTSQTPKITAGIR